MNWLHEHGVVANYDDYLALPMAVLNDCRLVMVAEAEDSERQRQKASGHAQRR